MKQSFFLDCGDEANIFLYIPYNFFFFFASSHEELHNKTKKKNFKKRSSTLQQCLTLFDPVCAKTRRGVCEL